MKCRYSKYLSRYVDGELSAEKMAEVREHIQRCSFCSQQIQEMEKVNKIMGVLKEVDVSPSYEYKFQMKLAERIAKKRWYEILREKVLTGIESVRRNLIPQPVVIRIALGVLLLVGAGYGWFYCQDMNKLKVMGLLGEVKVYRQDKLIAVREDARLERGDRITVADGSFIDVELKGKYRFRIKGDSEVRIEDIKVWGKGARTLLNLAKGRILVDIDKGYQGKEFRVKTVLGEVVAHGTEFSVAAEEDEEFWVGVLEGKVGVSQEGKKVIVKAGYKIEIRRGREEELKVLTPEERRMLEEIRKIGKVMVSLVLSREVGRVEEFLRRPRFYAFGKEPEEIKELLNKAGKLLNRALRTDSEKIHGKVIDVIEEVIEASEDREVEAKLMIFVAGYYRWLGKGREAVEVLEEVISKYSDMEEIGRFSMCALGEVYEEMGNVEEARQIYTEVIAKYKGSLEAEEARIKLNSLL